MKKNVFLLLALFLCGVSAAQIAPKSDNQVMAQPVLSLSQKVPHFQLTNGTMVDGLSNLSLGSLPGLHIGVEEVFRDKRSESLGPDLRFSLHLENKSIQEILNSLCNSDGRYTWSKDGNTINVYLRSSTEDPRYFLNQNVDHVSLTGIEDPTSVFDPLHTMFPKVPIVLMQSGGDISYKEPWTVSFDKLTVRQLINRVAEHLGPQSSWVVRGSQDSPIYTFTKNGFHVAN